VNRRGRKGLRIRRGEIDGNGRISKGNEGWEGNGRRQKGEMG